MSKFLQSMRSLVLARVQSMPCFELPSTRAVDFLKNFRGPSPYIIAEIKYQSPRGKIYEGDLSTLEIANSYVKAGASAISILTEPHYFDGDALRIKEVRQSILDIPILMKDFILSEKQVQYARYLGANAVLLLVAFLSKSELLDLYQCCLALSLTPLIEVHDLKELEMALSLDPNVIGINHRNLNTMMIDPLRVETLRPYIPSNICVIAESGLSCASQIMHLHQLGCDGFLMGSYFMQHDDPGLALSYLIQEFDHES